MSGTWPVAELDTIQRLRIMAAAVPGAAVAERLLDAPLGLQSRFLIIAMAAVLEPDAHTRVALTGGVRIPGRAAIAPIGVRREVRRSLDRLEQRRAVHR